MTYRFAVGHAGPAEKPRVLRPWPLPRAIGPAGGAVASVDDLLRYGELHLGDGIAPDGSRLLSAESMRQLHATRLVKHGTDEEMALAWQVSRIGSLREVWHDGATLGQHSLLFVVPERRLAVALLTNSVRGERFNHDMRKAIALEYLGVTLENPSPIRVPAAELAQYAGLYSRPFMDVEVTVDGDRLMIRRIQKQGFPSPASPVPPPPPPVPYVFYARDRLIGLGPVQGDRAEFLRRPDGTVGWIRVGGRVARRAVPGELEIVRAFLSTRDAKSGADELRTSRDLSHWLSRHGLLPAGTKLTEEDLERALEVRRGLRALAVANSGGELNAAAVSGLDQAAVGARAQVRFDADGASRLELVSRDFDDALGTLLGIVHAARMGGQWRALKICGDPGCRRAYYDFTKGLTGRWCTRRCGARMRARTARRGVQRR